jgi:hypothetical protein
VYRSKHGIVYSIICNRHVILNKRVSGNKPEIRRNSCNVCKKETQAVSQRGIICRKVLQYVALILDHVSTWYPYERTGCLNRMPLLDPFIMQCEIFFIAVYISNIRFRQIKLYALHKNPAFDGACYNYSGPIRESIAVLRISRI